MRSQDKLGAGCSCLGFSWLGLWSAGQGRVACPGPRGLCRGRPQAVASAVQLSGSICGHMAPSGETPAAEGEGAAPILAFWICVGTASRWGRGRRRPEWSLGVQVGLDMKLGSWQMVPFQHPSARAAGQAASGPGLIQLGPGQLCQVPSTLPPLPPARMPWWCTGSGCYRASDVGASGLSGVCVCDTQPRPERGFCSSKIWGVWKRVPRISLGWSKDHGHGKHLDLGLSPGSAPSRLGDLGQVLSLF